jgi:hypothetical protein
MTQSTIRSLTIALLFSVPAVAAEDWTHYVRIAGHGLGATNATAIVAESQKAPCVSGQFRRDRGET